MTRQHIAPAPETFTYLVTVSPAPGQSRRAHIVAGLVDDAAAYGGAVRMVADYVTRRYGNSFPVVDGETSGIWRLYNGTPAGRAMNPYATILVDTPAARADLGIPVDARRVIVLDAMATAARYSDTQPYTR